MSSEEIELDQIHQKFDKVNYHGFTVAEIFVLVFIGVFILGLILVGLWPLKRCLQDTLDERRRRKRERRDQKYRRRVTPAPEDTKGDKIGEKVKEEEGGKKVKKEEMIEMDIRKETPEEHGNLRLPSAPLYTPDDMACPTHDEDVDDDVDDTFEDGEGVKNTEVDKWRNVLRKSQANNDNINDHVNDASKHTKPEKAATSNLVLDPSNLPEAIGLKRKDIVKTYDKPKITKEVLWR